MKLMFLRGSNYAKSSLLLVFKTCLTRLRVITLGAQNDDWAQIKMHWTVQKKKDFTI